MEEEIFKDVPHKLYADFLNLCGGEVVNGDCLELMKKIPDKSIDMILCDLPYGWIMVLQLVSGTQLFLLSHCGKCFTEYCDQMDL